MIKSYTIHFTGTGRSDGSEYFLGMPFLINVAFSGIVFIYIGFLLRKLIERVSSITKKKWSLAIMIVCTLVGYVLYRINNGDTTLLAMSQADYGNYALFITTSVLLGISTLMLAILIDNPLFAKYGQYTMSIYAFHLAIVFIPTLIFKICPICINNYPELKGIVYGAIILIVSCVLIPFIQKIDSNLIGEHKII